MYRKLITVLLIIAGLLSACSSPSKESGIAGKWILGYAVDDGISIYEKEFIDGVGTDAVFLFTEDGKYVFANYEKEYNGTWQEVPTTDESKKKYEVAQSDGETAYVYQDIKVPEEIYIIGSEISALVSDKVIFVKDETAVDKAKMRSFEEAKSDVESGNYNHALAILAHIIDVDGAIDLGIDALVGLGDYEKAIEIAEEFEKPLEKIIELKNNYYDVLKETDLKAALQMAEELQKPQEEIDALKNEYETYVRENDPVAAYTFAVENGLSQEEIDEKMNLILAESLETGDFSIPKAIANDLPDDKLIEIIAKLEEARRAETTNLLAGINRYNKIDSLPAKERAKKLTPYLKLVEYYYYPGQYEMTMHVDAIYSSDGKICVTVDGPGTAIFDGPLGEWIESVDSSQRIKLDEDGSLILRRGVEPNVTEYQYEVPYKILSEREKDLPQAYEVTIDVEDLDAEELKNLYKEASKDGDLEKVFFESRAKMHSDEGILQLKSDGLHFKKDSERYGSYYGLDKIYEAYITSDGKLAIKTGAAVDFTFEILDRPADDWLLVIQGALPENRMSVNSQYAHVIGTYVNTLTGEPDVVVTNISENIGGWFLEGTYKGIPFSGSWHIDDTYMGIGSVLNTVRSDNQPSEIYIHDDGTALIRNYDSTKKQMTSAYYTKE